MAKSSTRQAKVISIGAPQRRAAVAGSGFLVGHIARVELGEIQVTFNIDGEETTALARSTVPIAAAHVGREVTIALTGTNPVQPVVTGLLQRPDELMAFSAHHVERAPGAPIHAKVDGERVTLEGEKEIELRCGQASILLTADGKIILKGTYLVSRSSGPNKIKGATVRIN